MTEKEWTANVLELLDMFGWRAIHMIPLRTKHGWRTAIQGPGCLGCPDVFAVKGDRLVAAELKVNRNKPDGDQQLWLELLQRAGWQGLLVVPR